jgi:hypothetical protein
MLMASLLAGPPASAATGAGPNGPAPVAIVSIPQALGQSPGGQVAARGVPAGSGGNGYLAGVSALSASDAWAVGWYEPTSGTQACAAPGSSGDGQCSLVEHWNGKTWTRVKSPNPAGSKGVMFEAVEAISATNVWAVGQYHCPVSVCSTKTLTEHWNGKSWKIVPSPNPTSSTLDPSNDLNGVTAVSANNVWAVGSYTDKPGSSGYDDSAGLVEHWDGKHWKIVKSPESPSDVELRGVAAVSATDIWAVGDDNAETGSGGGTIVERWNGKTWSSVHSPSPAPDYSNLYAVAAVSAKDLWAVGNDGAPYVARRVGHDAAKGMAPLIERWNGTKWQQVKSQNPQGGNTITGLISVDAVSADNAWAVGLYTSTSGPVKTLIEHWNGTAWSIVASPNPNDGSSGLQGVSGSSASNIWSVGVTETSSNDGQLYEKWNSHKNKWVIGSAS